jgi:two-component system response regulator RegA
MKSQNTDSVSLNLNDFSDKTLLILDDDDPFRSRLGRAMEKKGFVVVEAKSVEEGHKIAKKHTYKFCCYRP